MHVSRTNIMASERIVKVAGYRSSEAILAGRVAQLRIPRAIHFARSEFSIPLSLTITLAPTTLIS